MVFINEGEAPGGGSKLPPSKAPFGRMPVRFSG